MNLSRLLSMWKSRSIVVFDLWVLSAPPTSSFSFLTLFLPILQSYHNLWDSYFFLLPYLTSPGNTLSHNWCHKLVLAPLRSHLPSLSSMSFCSFLNIIFWSTSKCSHSLCHSLIFSSEKLSIWGPAGFFCLLYLSRIKQQSFHGYRSRSWIESIYSSFLSASVWFLCWIYVLCMDIQDSPNKCTLLVLELCLAPHIHGYSA